MRLAFVVQRYGLDIAGGAEYHCRLVAEHLQRHADVSVLTTCARDYIDWRNHYPAGTDVLNGVRVHRFPVERERDLERFAYWSRRVLDAPHSDDDESRWLDEQGPLAPALVRHVEERQSDFDFFVFFSYRYYTTYHGLRAVANRALLVPTAEDDGVYRLRLFPPLFRAPRAIVYNSEEERRMIGRASGNDAVPGDVVGVGSALPAATDPAGFRDRYGLRGPFVLYVGRIDRNKGCDQLFEFMSRYWDETGSEIPLVLAGHAVLDVPDDDRVVHLGFVSDQGKWDAIAACDALMMPSRYESLSMVTLEAWWARRPVLANAKCDVLRGQCKRSQAGLYYGSYDEFAACLQLLESDADLRRRLGENGHRYYQARYAWPVIEGKYLRLLERARAAA